MECCCVADRCDRHPYLLEEYVDFDSRLQTLAEFADKLGDVGESTVWCAKVEGIAIAGGVRLRVKQFTELTAPLPKATRKATDEEEKADIE